MHYKCYDPPSEVSTNEHYSAHPIGVPVRKTRKPRRRASLYKRFSRNLSSFVTQSICVLLTVAVVVGFLLAVYRGDSSLAVALVVCISGACSYWLVRKVKSK